MFKRLSILAICLLYFVTASGFALNAHYCLGQLRSVKIDVAAQPCSKKKMSKKCCHDKQVKVKVKDVHKAPSQSFLSKIFQIDLPRLPFEQYFMPEEDQATAQAQYRGPPDAAAIPVYIKNCNLRI